MTDESPGTDRPSPYRGLEPFDERDAPFFFGRERERRLITASLFAAPLTLLYGASGVGKSSVLRAGVLPRLRERSDLLPVVFPRVGTRGSSDGARIVERGWQNDPLGGLKETTAIALYDAAGDDFSTRARYQDAVLRSEMAPLREFLAACSEASGRRLMIILDQFEEYSLYHPEDDAFGEQFPEATAGADRDVSFLVSLREDAVARLDRFKGRIPTLWDSYRRIEHLDHRAAQDAIRLPLGEYNRRRAQGDPPIEIEDALVDAVLRQVPANAVRFDDSGAGTVAAADADSRIETPYLQLVMTRLWEREQEEHSTTLRVATLEAEGGAETIVRTHLDRVMQDFTSEERALAARVFHRLVTPSGTKIAFSVGDLAAYEAIDQQQLGAILRRLEEGNRRILRRVANRGGDEPRYEIFHDRLGKAILSWRTKHMEELAREESKRAEAALKKITEETRARFREYLATTLGQLTTDERATFAAILPYLVTTRGMRISQSARTLASHSQQPLEAVEITLKRLIQLEIVRRATAPPGLGEPWYQVVHDQLAPALLEWRDEHVALTTGGALAPADAPVLPPTRDREAAAHARSRFPFGVVSDLMRRGQVITILGGGVSLSARHRAAPGTSGKLPGTPSNRELKELLARECDFPAAELESSDVAEVASFYVYRLDRAALDRRLSEIFGRLDAAPSDTHRYLAETARSTPLLILTTNFDTLMERALDDAAVAYDVTAYSTQRVDSAVTRENPSAVFVPKIRIDRDAPRTTIVRLHGPAHEAGEIAGSYVITEEDQIDWLMQLNQGRGLPRFLREALDRGYLLLLGQSARDWTQRALLRIVEPQFRRSTGWAVALDPAPFTVMAWQRYHVEVHNFDLNDWVARMRDG
jgi:hypothetical protein